MADGGTAGKGASVISIRELMDGGTVDFTGSGSQPLNRTAGGTLEIIQHCELLKTYTYFLDAILDGARRSP